MKSIVMTPGYSDSELTAGALAGQRDAFAQIVMRYQSLVCSLAYSATGSLSQSEDLAQETFIAAWKGLRTLREPEKLRSWLCSIARNIIAGAVRHKKQEPALTAESLDALQDHASSELLPVDRAISSEEESILWNSLEHIPEAYREPLVLFYREGQSIERVAEKLELSEEAVKQRLSRGRKLLKLEVAAFVESALGRSTPGRGFTAAVLAGIPEFSMPVAASSVGVAVSKGTAMAKTASVAGFIAGVLVPLMATLGGFLSTISAYKSARSGGERALLKRGAAVFFGVFVIGNGTALWLNDDLHSTVIMTATIIALMCVCLALMLLKKRLRERIRIEEGRVHEKANASLSLGRPDSPGYKRNLYAEVLVLTFCNPFAFLTIQAANAHDSAVLFTMLAILAVMFMSSRRILMRRPEQWLNCCRTILIAQFVLLVIVVQLRWELWTGRSPWQLQSDLMTLLAVGFLLFVFAIFHWLLMAKRNR